jgi:pyruvate dehydrogenase E1 component
MQQTVDLTGPVGDNEEASAAALERLARRVLWLSTMIVHHANHIRPNRDGLKVGGHQASSASVVQILTSLYFDFLRAGDRVSVKPHASPVFHAIQYLLGNLDRRYLTELRALHGLQAYPSRTKDPDPVDFSTGSVGLGAVAPNFAALVGRYVEGRFGQTSTERPRFVSVVGDAELDEGSIWEAVGEPALGGIDNVLWVVDLNRQSLDRVVPEIRTPKLQAMFKAHGWHVVEAKYGQALQRAFALPQGELFRHAVDAMPNPAYQRMLRAPSVELRDRLCVDHPQAAALRAFLGQWTDDDLAHLIRNLGGHDLITLRHAFAESTIAGAPTVVFAYTIKGWGLPMEGDPANHSALLSQRQIDTLREAEGITAEDSFPRFDSESAEGRLCADAARRLKPEPPTTLKPAAEPPTVPDELGHAYHGSLTTQGALGQVLVGLAREFPAVAERVVTASPDVATSTNLGGWINRVGVWAGDRRRDYFDDAGPRAQNWVEAASGRHIELGISENNLCLLLGQLGLAGELHGELLFPIGTLYDPFVARGLDALIYGVYCGGRFIIVGTPSGVTLSPEGGAHQSTITPSIGLAMPGLVAYEPCFAQELEWILLDSLRGLADRAHGQAVYLRLSTRSVDQGFFPIPEDPIAREALRKAVLAGAYRLIDRTGSPDYAPGENVAQIFACGAVIPDAIAASHELTREGVQANVINVTSADRLFRGYQESLLRALHGPGFPHPGPLVAVVPEAERSCPIVTVLDGHPHALAWVGGALGARVLPLGVTRFGESGTQPELYEACSIDKASIVEAVLLAMDR